MFQNFSIAEKMQHNGIRFIFFLSDSNNVSLIKFVSAPQSMPYEYDFFPTFTLTTGI
jgi:hypothetical protein